MVGMTGNQLTEVLAFIQKYHCFGYVPKEDRLQRNGKDHWHMIKYVDMCYDTRDQSIWMIKLRGINLIFATNHFSGVNLPPEDFPYDTLFDWVMGYLKGEWYNTSILNKMVFDDNKK